MENELDVQALNNVMSPEDAIKMLYEWLNNGEGAVVDSDSVPTVLETAIVAGQSLLKGWQWIGKEYDAVSKELTEVKESWDKLEEEHAKLMERYDELERDYIEVSKELFVTDMVNSQLTDRNSFLADYNTELEKELDGVEDEELDEVDGDELWIDVVIKPVRPVEFIYIPIRVGSVEEI